jgi:hypothetical protein
MPHLFATLHEVSKWRWNICRQRLLARQPNEPGSQVNNQEQNLSDKGSYRT